MEKINVPLIQFPEEIKSTPKERMGFYLGQVLAHQSGLKKWMSKNKELSKMNVYKEKEKTFTQLQEVVDSIVKEYPDFKAFVDAAPLIEKFKEVTKKVG